MVSELKKHVSWNVFGNIGGKVLMPLFQVLIARQLHPRYYGTFGVAMALVYLFDIVKDLGFTEAIIVERPENDISSQYTLQIVTAAIMYGLLALFAPLVSMFFRNSEYLTVLPIIGVVFFAKAIIDPLTTLYLKKQMFKMLAIRQILSPIVFGCCGYLFAAMGWGVYSLVVSTVVSYVVVSLVFYIGKTEPLTMIWDIEAKKKLFKLGKHILIQRFAGYGVHQGDTFIIGRILSMNDLGLYKTASYIINTIPNCVINQTQQVLFTELSIHKMNGEYLRRRYYHFMEYAGVFLVVYMIIMSVAAPYLVPMALGWQWRMLIPFIQIFSCGVVVGYMTGLNNDISRILGFTEVYTKYTVLRSVCTMCIVCAMAFVSLKAAACAWVLSSFVAACINERLLCLHQTILRISMTKIIAFFISVVWFVFMVLSIYYKPDFYMSFFGGNLWVN